MRSKAPEIKLALIFESKDLIPCDPSHFSFLQISTPENVKRIFSRHLMTFEETLYKEKKNVPRFPNTNLHRIRRLIKDKVEAFHFDNLDLNLSIIGFQCTAQDIEALIGLLKYVKGKEPIKQFISRPTISI